MQDLTRRQISLSAATAVGVVFCSAETVAWLQEGKELSAAILFERARMAGFLGSKATAQLLPHRHLTVIDGLKLEFAFLQQQKHTELFPGGIDGKNGITITAEAKAVGRFGLDMEAMMAVSVAALEIFSALQPHDSKVEICHIKPLTKTTGKHKGQKYFAKPPTCAVLVCSDSTAAGQREDASGQLIRQMLEEVNANVQHYVIVPDCKTEIQKQLRAWVAGDVHFIFTTGGTGLGPRDHTVCAVKEILERDADGIAEAMRAYGQQRTPMAMMSRGVAGSIGQTLVVTLPGSTSGARESLEAILPGVFHARKMMKGGGH